MSAYLLGFAAFLIIGVPVALALGLASLVYLYVTGNTHLLVAFPQRMVAGIDQFVLLTIPFFLLAGNFMNVGGITEEIVRLAQTLVGRIKGGLAAVTVVASMLFSGVSGAATAEASALGSVLIPAMKRDGYDPRYAAALVAASSILGPLVPPSLALILYGVLSGTSIGDLFMGGIVPALLLCLALITYVLIKARREDHPLPPPVNESDRRRGVWRGAPALLLPVIIVGGIKSGAFTPTEAAAIAALYALLIAAFLYRSMTMKGFAQALFETATLSAGILLIVAMASMTAFVLGFENVPRRLANMLLSVTEEPALILLMMNAFLLLLGLFLEPLAALILVMPVLVEVVDATGVDPVQFGVMVVLNLMIGMITPPVGLCLFIVSAIGRTPVEGVSRAAWPMILIAVAVLLLVAFVPPLSLFLPGLFR